MGRTPAPLVTLRDSTASAVKRAVILLQDGQESQEGHKSKCTDIPGLRIGTGKQATAVQNPLSTTCGQHLGHPWEVGAEKAGPCHHSPPLG